MVATCARVILASGANLVAVLPSVKPCILATAMKSCGYMLARSSRPQSVKGRLESCQSFSDTGRSMTPTIIFAKCLRMTRSSGPKVPLP